MQLVYGNIKKFVVRNFKYIILHGQCVLHTPVYPILQGCKNWRLSRVFQIYKYKTLG